MKGFKAKTSKFGSLLSLIILSAMLMVFVSQIPLFMESSTGRIFAGFWALFAVTMFAAHILRLTGQRQRYLAMMPQAGGAKDARTRKSLRRMRALRG